MPPKAALLSIEGGIGVGKSTVLAELKRHLAGDPLIAFVDEPVDKWVSAGVLKSMYEGTLGAAVFQHCALMTRVGAIVRAFRSGAQVVITERSPYSDRLFARANLNTTEAAAYNLTFDEILSVLPEDLTRTFVLLKCPVDRLVQRIETRGRQEERHVSRAYLRAIADEHDKFALEHAISFAKKPISSMTDACFKELDAKMPDWRELDASTFCGEDFKHIGGNQKYIVEFNTKNEAVRHIGSVTTVYKFLSPKTWASNIVESVGRFVPTGADVSLLEHQVTNTSVLLLIKVPMAFDLATDDSFGLTLLAHNFYNGSKAQQLGFGAIRAACTNGQVWGDHASLSLKHCGNEGKEGNLDSYLHRLLINGSQYAKEYLAPLKECVYSLESVCVPYDKSATCDGSGYAAAKTMEDATKPLVHALASMHLLPYQQMLVMRRIVERALQQQPACSAYELYNDCTAVASHDLPLRANTLKVRTDMMHKINSAFSLNGPVRKPESWKEKRLNEHANAVREWKEWSSFDPTTPYGPETRKKKRAREAAEGAAGQKN